MVDRWGPRKVLTVAIALCAPGSLIFATAGGIGGAYGGRLLIGVKSQVALVASTIAGRAVPRARAWVDQDTVHE